MHAPRRSAGSSPRSGAASPLPFSLQPLSRASFHRKCTDRPRCTATTGSRFHTSRKPGHSHPCSGHDSRHSRRREAESERRSVHSDRRPNRSRCPHCKATPGSRWHTTHGRGCRLNHAHANWCRGLPRTLSEGTGSAPVLVHSGPPLPPLRLPPPPQTPAQAQSSSGSGELSARGLVSSAAESSSGSDELSARGLVSSAAEWVQAGHHLPRFSSLHSS